MILEIDQQNLSLSAICEENAICSILTFLISFAFLGFQYIEEIFWEAKERSNK